MRKLNSLSDDLLRITTSSPKFDIDGRGLFIPELIDVICPVQQAEETKGPSFLHSGTLYNTP